jgi:hypothetical protein
MLACLMDGAPGALAYIDPGIGSIVFQALLAGVLTGAYAVRRYWSRISAFFSRQSRADETDDPDA